MAIRIPTRRAARSAAGPPAIPRVWRLTPTDVAGVLIANGVVLVGMWLRHGGLDQLTDAAGWLTATGQLTALLGTYVALVQLVLMSRAPWIDRVLGADRVARWHRWLGFACLWSLVGHAVFTTLGFAAGDGRGVVEELWTFLTGYPWVLMATVGLALLVAVAVTSMRAARRRLSYETWYGIHLYAYLGIALAFLHEVVVGTDFVDDPVAIGYWVGALPCGVRSAAVVPGARASGSVPAPPAAGGARRRGGSGRGVRPCHGS